MTDNFRGFMSNAHDTKIMSSYVDENELNGLKQNSKMYLGYEQVSYKTVTAITAHPNELPKGGKFIAEGISDDGDPWVTRQYRMNELTAEHCIAYGADDTICTAALYNFYSTIMEIEQTMEVFKEVEVKPAYLTALGYIKGAHISISRLKELEREDDKTFDTARDTLSKVLLDKGILDQMWKPYTEWSTTIVKDACEELFGFRPDTMVRKPAKLATMILAESNSGDSDVALQGFCAAVERSDLKYINGLLLNKFKAEPAIDVNSSKKMKEFLYDILKLPVRVTSKLTPDNYKFDTPLVKAVNKFKKFLMEDKKPDLTPAEWEQVRRKASTDDTAVDFALMYDKDIDPDLEVILKSLSDMKKIMTRRGLYYKPYPYLKHWKDGLIHSSMNQCATVTRRYSSSGPNLQQLPKKGDGVKIRQMIVPHHKDAVIVSLDFSGQELRLAAHMSQDANMLSCYIGENLKDPHSITASGAMLTKWGKQKVEELKSLVGMENLTGPDFEYTLFIKLHKGVDDEAIHKLADDLRKVAKNVNFGAQYDAQALTLAYTIVIPVKDAQDFLDAREKMFPGVTIWKDDVRKRVERLGYATTLMGARRHLGKLLQNSSTKNKAGRQGPNFEIQSSSAEQTKLAMGKVWDSGVMYDYDCQFVAPVHDELVFSIHRDHAVEAIRIIHHCMTMQYHDMTVPCLSSISLGPNFGVQHEAGDHFDAAKITSILKDIFKGSDEAQCGVEVREVVAA